MKFGDVDSGVYVPSDWQTRIHLCDADEVLGAGSAGPGKSLCLLMDALQHQVPIEHARCEGNPGLVAQPGSWLWKLIEENPIEWGDSSGWCLFLMRDNSRLLQTLARARKFFKKFDPGVEYSAEHHMYTFSSGYRYQFGHCFDINDWEKYDSNQYTELCFDELTQFDEVQYDSIAVRLRSKDPVLSKFLRTRAMSNPQRRSSGSAKVTDPFWVRKRFVDPCKEGNKLIRRRVKEIVEQEDGELKEIEYEATRVYMPALLSDNPDKAFAEQYRRKLATNHRKHIVQSMLRGDWYVVAGAFFSDSWDKGVHVSEPFSAPREWRFFRSMDWGFKTHGVICWWALDYENTLYCIYEHTFRMKTAEYVAADIKAIELRFKLWDKVRDVSMLTGPSDNQLWERRGDVGPSKAQTFAQNGVLWTKADKKSRKMNAELLTGRLERHREDESGVPGIVFFRQADKCITTIPATGTDQNDVECPADEAEGHWLDTTLYGCAYAAKGFRALPALPESESAFERLEGLVKKENAPSRRQWGYGTSY